MNVAVIGGGAAGLVTARRLLAHGHRISVLEKAPAVGGTWRQSPDSALYDSLRTNLPKQVMQFQHDPFDAALPAFLGHRDVLAYLERFASEQLPADALRLGREVGRVERDAVRGWRVDGERFDAVAVCTGHYSAPYVPPDVPADVPLVVHSHAYRSPAAFRGRRVAVVGAGASAADLTLELGDAVVAVVLPEDAEQVPSWAAETAQADVVRGLRRLPAGAADCLLLCTGYRYALPFLDPALGVADGEFVAPLFEHLFFARDPTLAFVGLPVKVTPFRLFELQATWLARVWAGEVPPPPRGRADAERSHLFEERQWGYLRRVAAAAGVQPPPLFVERLYREAFRARAEVPRGYRELEMGWPI